MKKFYSLEEVCQLLNIKPAQVKFFEEKFNIKKCNPKDYPTKKLNYNSEEVEILNMIKFLVIDEMYSISGAKKKLNQLINNFNIKLSILDDLENVLAMFEED